MRGRLTRRDMLRLSGGTLAGAAVLGLAGCGGGGSGSSGNASKTLTLGNIGWAENVAISNLTKVLLEEELNYQQVQLQTLDLGVLFQGVAGGDLHAFQDVWMPNNQNYLDQVGDDVELLDPWYEDESAYGIAVPDYMDLQSLADLNEAGTNQITGIEPGASFHEQIRNEVIPQYNLDMELVESSTAGMLSELENKYGSEEPIVFLGWSPHWMNEEYDFHYLDDPKNAQGSFDEPARLTTIVNADLSEDDPVAYAFLNAISINEEEINQIGAEINSSGDEIEGVKTWLEGNRDVVQAWVQAAKDAQ